MPAWQSDCWQGWQGAVRGLLLCRCTFVTPPALPAALQVSTCPTCGGSGEQFTPCNKCQGDGRVRGSKRISLRVPPGVDDGSRLRVRGEGDTGRR